MRKMRVEDFFNRHWTGSINISNLVSRKQQPVS